MIKTKKNLVGVVLYRNAKNNFIFYIQRLSINLRFHKLIIEISISTLSQLFNHFFFHHRHDISDDP